jgi:RNA polymerase sigma-70 factor (ECF subfamily)
VTAAATPDFPALFREHAPFVWRVLRRHGVAESDLADLCQEVFIVVLRKLPEFRGESSVRTWIYTVAARVAAGHRRLARVRREQATDELPVQIEAGTPERTLTARLALAQLEEALGQLKEEQREAFVLFELEDMTVDEVAEALGCARGTAYSRIQAARDGVDAHVKRLAARSASNKPMAGNAGVST